MREEGQRRALVPEFPRSQMGGAKIHSAGNGPVGAKTIGRDFRRRRMRARCACPSSPWRSDWWRAVVRDELFPHAPPTSPPPKTKEGARGYPGGGGGVDGGGGFAGGLAPGRVAAGVVGGKQLGCLARIGTGPRP
eukprot:ctg_471.g278